jgi:hypothetical protein
METIWLGIKTVEFAVMELFVVVMLGSALVLGLQQIVRDYLRESHQADGFVPEPQAAIS